MIFFVAPLPPPVGGFSLASKGFLDKLSVYEKVIVFNRSGVIKKKVKVLYFIFAILKSMWMWSVFLIKILIDRPRAMYLALSGGTGQFLDMPFVFMAKIFCRKIYVHHHSFSYILKPKWFNRFVFWLLRKENHIVLCDDMGLKIAGIYGIKTNNFFTLSNAVFMDDVGNSVKDNKSDEREIVVGYISNICSEKGVFEYLKAVENLRKSGLRVRGLIAGPVNEECRENFLHVVCENSSFLEYLGPVYGNSKRDFFQSIDVLLFPTKYLNEAEPLILFEAASNGVYVIASLRGCIASQIDYGAILSNSDNLVNDAVREVKNFILMKKNEDGGAGWFKCRKEKERVVLNKLLSDLSGIEIL